MTLKSGRGSYELIDAKCQMFLKYFKNEWAEDFLFS